MRETMVQLNWYQGSQLSHFRENESRYGHTSAMK